LIFLLLGIITMILMALHTRVKLNTTLWDHYSLTHDIFVYQRDAGYESPEDHGK